MQQFAPGNVVSSIAGRDRKHLYVVVAVTPERVMVADGRRRGLNNPKPKNPIHLQLIQPNASYSSTDDDIRQILRSITAEQSQASEEKGGNN
jgi:ribosomal protein L14E/L6E/L27E